MRNTYISKSEKGLVIREVGASGFIVSILFLAQAIPEDMSTVKWILDQSALVALVLLLLYFYRMDYKENKERDKLNNDRLNAIISNFEKLADVNTKALIINSESSKRLARALERKGVVNESEDT